MDVESDLSLNTGAAICKASYFVSLEGLVTSSAEQAERDLSRRTADLR